MTILALTAEQRFNAMKGFNTSTNATSERWFILTGAFAVLLLTILFMAVTYKRSQQERKTNKKLFHECADKISLTNRQRQLLLEIAVFMKLKHLDSIFTLDKAFDKGAAKITEKNLSQQGSQENERLRTEVSELRQKLGFGKEHISAIGQISKSKKLSTRQIPVNKKLYISPTYTSNLPDIATTIIKNNDTELTVKLQEPLKTSTGDIWQGRYYFGSSVWEFDASVVSCSATMLVLNHSDDVRFINLRRFFSMKVNKPAFVAKFPFEKTVTEELDAIEDSANTDNWAMLKLSPAVITELSGPNLHIETRMKVKIHDRIIVFFKLDEQTTSPPDQKDEQSITITSKIIQDIAEVKKAESIPNGFSLEIELTGLSDTDINELIRAANSASTKKHALQTSATTG